MPQSDENTTSRPTESDGKPSEEHDDSKVLVSSVPKSTAELASQVVAFLQKLEPWKGIMPTALLSEMEHIHETALDCEQTDNKSESSGPPEVAEFWSYEIPKLDMETWKVTLRNRLEPPIPVIQSFFLKSATNSSLGTLPADFSSSSAGSNIDIAGDHNSLERVMINSSLVIHELELMLSTSIVPGSVVVAPPYKVLLQCLPQLKVRLVELEHKLTELDRPRERKQQQNGRLSTINEEDHTTAEIGQETGATSEIEDRENSSSERFFSREDEPTLEDHVSLRDRATLSARFSHLQCLLRFINSNLGGYIELRDQIAQGTLERIAFGELWHLFKPGDFVVGKYQGREQLYRVYFTTGGQIQRSQRGQTNQKSDGNEREEASGVGTWTPFKVDTYGMDFDGDLIGPVENFVLIKPFIGKQAIRELPVYPLQFHPKEDNLLARLEDRGRRFLSSSGHKYYEGLTGSSMSRLNTREDIASEVFVDFQGYYDRHTYRKPELGYLRSSKQDRTETLEMIDNETGSILHYGHEVDISLTEAFMASNRASLEPFKPADVKTVAAECLLLLPHMIPGYAFRHRRWYHLDIDNVQEINPDRYSGFNDLVIPDRYRDLLVALVNNHASGHQRRKEKLKKSLTAGGTDHAQIDLVAGKGQGLIILLHGPPGSGKTSTAETIAAYTQRPLYSITCGDIGLDPEEAEAQLTEHTVRADKWGCVLLIDEADVFLMRRTWKELKRNALVSVFLRQIEYYSGILFLTTNRPGTIDEAFKSRIHVSLRYPGVDLQSTKKMWENIMKRLVVENESADIKIEFNQKKLLDFAEQEYRRHQKNGMTWNGRQIRNAFQTALALGHADRLVAIRAADKTPEWAAASGKKKWMTVKLTTKNLRVISRTTREFEEYIVRLRGRDSDAAREEEIRDDDDAYRNEYPEDDPPARKKYGAVVVLGGGSGSRGGLRGSNLQDEQYQVPATFESTGGPRGPVPQDMQTSSSSSESDEDDEEDEAA